jgi:phage tail protein X
VVEGDTISELALKVYGHHSILALDLIQEFNPAVTDLNRIDIGQRLVLPSLSRKTLLRQQGDGQYNLILGTFPDRYSAKCAVDFVREKGYHASIIKRRVTSDRSLYRVELKKLPDLAAVDRIWGFVGRRKS